MYRTVSISTSGAAHSLLLYETVKSSRPQEGFILGTILIKDSQMISDESENEHFQKCTIKINTIIPCPRHFYFYYPDGKVNFDKIKTFLGQQIDKVVGWYIFRPNKVTGRLQFREKVVHKSLCKYFSELKPGLICGILTKFESRSKATHTFLQKFMRLKDGQFENVPFKIENLGEIERDYKSCETSSQMLSSLVKRSTSVGMCTAHLAAVEIHHKLVDDIKKKVKKLAIREQVLFQLEEEVKMLQGKIEASERSTGSGDTLYNRSFNSNKAIQQLNVDEKLNLSETVSSHSTNRGRSKQRPEIN